MPERTSEPVIKISFSLYPEQHGILNQFAKESGLENASAALRLIINEWARMRAAGISLPVVENARPN